MWITNMAISPSHPCSSRGDPFFAWWISFSTLATCLSLAKGTVGNKTAEVWKVWSGCLFSLLPWAPSPPPWPTCTNATAHVWLRPPVVSWPHGALRWQSRAKKSRSVPRWTGLKTATYQTESTKVLCQTLSDAQSHPHFLYFEVFPEMYCCRGKA